MTLQLLTTEEFVKGLLTIDENVAGDYIGTAIMEAQEIGLKSIVGSALLASLKDKAEHGTMAGAYAELNDRAQFYLGYKACAELLPKISYKITNMGAVRTSDTNVQNLSRTEVDALVEYYQVKADFHCAELQRWLCHNSASFPELGECGCDGIRPNLKSAATTAVWLGGARAKRRGE